ncbi:MAG: CoA-binding protein [Calditrichaeota bacterium]|nr:MAG: CoA-binding protein [Calditrichota bacterium]MBL1205523.1 CoA-binding protein [Calditrichota bacterium]NOG45352.1 CoA-binding protein [Calditrichota bacterium]
MNESYRKKIDDFLGLRHIAVVGYSSEGNQPGNFIYDKLIKNEYTVFAVNPKNESVKDINCFASLKDVPEKIEGVIICTPPAATLEVVKMCKELNIQHVWMHRSFDQGSFNKEAESFCIENNINCISSGCPMMFLKADVAHKCMKWILDLTGKLA